MGCKTATFFLTISIRSVVKLRPKVILVFYFSKLKKTLYFKIINFNWYVINVLPVIYVQMFT